MRSFVLSILALTANAASAQQQVPEIPFDASVDFLKLPAGMNLGEVAGVAIDARRHLYVFSRTGLTQHGARRELRRSSSSSGPTARSSARSARISTVSRSRTRCASTTTATSGRRTKART